MYTEIAHMGGQLKADEYDVDLEEGTASEKPAEPASQAMVLVVIPRGIGYELDLQSFPGRICIKIPIGLALQ